MRVACMAAGIALIAALVAYFALGPIIVRAQVERALHDLGADRASFDLDSFSLSELRLNNVALGDPPWMTAGSIGVSYTFGSLWDGRVRSIDVNEARWVTRIGEDGELDLGFQPRGGAAGPFDPPFERVTLANFSVIVEHQGVEQSIKVNGEFVRSHERAMAVDLQVTADAPINVESLRVDGVKSSIRLRAEFMPSEIRIYANDGGRIDFSSVALADAGGRSYQVERIQMDVAASGLEPLARVVFDDGGTNAAVSAQISSASPASLTAAGLEATVPNYSLAVNASRQANEPVQYAGVFKATSASFSHASQPFRAEGFFAALPFSSRPSSDASENGSFSIASIWWRDHEWPGLTGSAAIAGGRAEAALAWPLLDEATLHARAWLQLAGGATRGEIVANILPFQWRDAEPIVQLAPELQGMTIGGTYALDARVQYENGRVVPWIQMTGEEIALSSDDWPAAIESAAAAVTIDSLDPISTAARQRVQVHAARVGELEIESGEIQFTLERADSMLVHEASWSMGDMGQFRAAPFQFNPASPRFQTTISGERIDLEEWLPLLTNRRATASGELQGEVTMGFDAATSQKVFFGRGQLSATAGGGFIQARDARALSELLEKRDPRFATDERLRQVKEGIIRALEDFAYDEVNVALTPQGRDVPFQVQLKGRGRRGPVPQELDLTFNFNDFNTLMRTAIFGQSLMNGE